MKGAESENERSWVIGGRTICAHDISLIRDLVTQHVGASRSALARRLCEGWQWRSPNGRWKERAALGLLRELDRRGWIVLPAAFPTPLCGPFVRVDRAFEGEAEPTPVSGHPSDYRPLRWELVRSTPQRREWQRLLEAHHYLGAPRSAGATLKYLVYGRGGQLLGVLGWQSAVPHLGARDRLLGWTAAQRARGLEHVVNNTRFLVPSWVRVPHLASVLLSEGVSRLRADWWEQYRVAVWRLESFVDRQRFSGASYRAANWVSLGWTRGFAKRQGRFVHHGQNKEVYVDVLEPRWRQWVHADPLQPLLSSSFLLTQRLSQNTPTLLRRRRMKTIQESWQPKLPPTLKLQAQDLACVAPELAQFTGQFGDAFGRIELTDLCALYVQGLLSDTARKNAEAIALNLDGPGRGRGLQRFLSEYAWDEEWLRQKPWELCAQALADEQGVWSVDASEFPKKGDDSVGVAHPYCGALGKTANCQSGGFVCYRSPRGHALLDARLYRPEGWFDDAHAQRRRQCRVPGAIGFQTKPQLASHLLEELWRSGRFPGRWITCDASFGNNEEFLASLPVGSLYLAEIPCTRKVWLAAAAGHPRWESEGGTVDQLVGDPGLLEWQSRKLAEGEKGPIVAGFARVRVLVRADRRAGSERWLFLRNNPDGQIK